jgi:hypothetical protein
MALTGGTADSLGAEAVVILRSFGAFRLSFAEIVAE